MDVIKGGAVIQVLIILLAFALGALWGNGSATSPIIIEQCGDALSE
jgi:hypothetical protein